MNAPFIRPAEARDAPALVALINALNHHEAELVDDRRTDLAAARECLASLEARIERQGGSILVALRQAEIVGMIGYVVERDEPYVKAYLREHALITDLVVAEAQRSAGIGGALIEAVETDACHRGLSRLAISVLAANPAARDVYSRRGFEDYLQIMVKQL